MSKDKKNGSITPLTIRRTECLKLEDNLVENIRNYDSYHSEQYLERNQKRKNIVDIQDKNLKVLDKLSKYSIDGPFKKVKTKFDQQNKNLSKTTENIKSIEQISGSLEFVTVFQHRKSEDTLYKEFNLFKPIVRHYGINAKNSSIFIEHVIKKGQLHPLEVSIFQRALKHLDTLPDAQTFLTYENRYYIPKPNNVVLVSFFPRGNDDKLLNLEQTIVADMNVLNEVETHTIILWKTGPKEITIIDPTDRTFSEFLINILNDSSKDITFQMEKSYLDGLDGRIYRPKYFSGKKPLVDARDCTDIAVKIAFELNQNQVIDPLNSVESVLASSIEQITNTSLPKEIGLFRALQSSSVHVREAAKLLIDTVKEKEQELKNKNSDQFKDVDILKILDISKIENIEDISTIYDLIGQLDIEDIYI